MVKVQKCFFLVVAISMGTPQTYSNDLYSSEFKPNTLQDDDKDGVINIRDKCRNTPLNAQVDNYGCPVIQTTLLSEKLKILFDSGKSNIQPRFYQEIIKLADFLKANPDSNTVIEGHTDNIGNSENNKLLSQNRASAIASVLINRFNISSSRIKAIGYGESRPIADNETDEGRAKNRRVVAEVFSKKSTSKQKWDIYSVDKSIH